MPAGHAAAEEVRGGAEVRHGARRCRRHPSGGARVLLQLRTGLKYISNWRTRIIHALLIQLLNNYGAL